MKGVFPQPGKDGWPDPLPPGTQQYQAAGPKDFGAFVSAIDTKVNLAGYNSVRTAVSGSDGTITELTRNLGPPSLNLQISLEEGLSIG